MRLELVCPTDVWQVIDEELAACGWSVMTDQAARWTEFWYDTPGFALLRWGATLVRVNDDDWRLHVPARAGARARDVTVTADVTTPPSCIADVVRPLVRGWAVQRLLTTELTCRHVGLGHGDGENLVTLSREERSVLDGPGVGRTLTSWAIEGDGQEAWQALEKILRKRGARRSAPAAVRALGSAARGPADVVIAPLGRSASAASVLGVALARDIEELLFRLAGIPLDEDPEDVHRARVVTRRMRGVFQTFGKLFRPETTTVLVDDLAWLADQLGPVRDADVMLERLEETSAMLSEDNRPAADGTVKLLAEQRRSCWGKLLSAMRMPRCVRLLDSLVALVSEGLPLKVQAKGSAAPVLSRYTRQRWRRLQRQIKRMPANPTEQDLHRSRIAAKRVRHACETVALVVGKPARRLAEKVAALQDALGAHQDAAVLRDWLRQVAREHPDLALAASELAGVESARIEATAAVWREIWDAMDRKRYWRWMCG
ncbi:MAG: CHAD domain-containing protein [Anaerolineae bacterium]|nr:CHAD domain-containing protein [Anaerolineae bacterium]